MNVMTLLLSTHRLSDRAFRGGEVFGTSPWLVIAASALFFILGAYILWTGVGRYRNTGEEDQQALIELTMGALLAVSGVVLAGLALVALSG